VDYYSDIFPYQTPIESYNLSLSLRLTRNAAYVGHA